MTVARTVSHCHSVGKFRDVILLAVPFGQIRKIVVHRIPRLAEVTVDHGVQLLWSNRQPLLIHLRPDGVLDVVVYLRPVMELAFQAQAEDLIVSGHHVVMELISHAEPLLDYLGRRAFAVGLTLLVEVPGAFSLHVLVAGVDYARRIGIVLAEVLGGIVEHLLLVDAVSQTDVAEMADILVVAVTLEDIPLFIHHFQDLFSGLFHTRHTFC